MQHGHTTWRHTTLRNTVQCNAVQCREVQCRAHTSRGRDACPLSSSCSCDGRCLCFTPPATPATQPCPLPADGPPRDEDDDVRGKADEPSASTTATKDDSPPPPTAAVANTPCVPSSPSSPSPSSSLSSALSACCMACISSSACLPAPRSSSSAAAADEGLPCASSQRGLSGMKGREASRERESRQPGGGEWAGVIGHGRGEGRGGHQWLCVRTLTRGCTRHSGMSSASVLRGWPHTSQRQQSPVHQAAGSVDEQRANSDRQLVTAAQGSPPIVW